MAPIRWKMLYLQ